MRVGGDEAAAEEEGGESEEEVKKNAGERATSDGGGAAHPPPKRAGDFSIGSAVWPGTSKLIEEQGELLQVLGKLMATGGDPNHWSGDLRAKLVEEIADVAAALAFFQVHNLTVVEMRAVNDRVNQKLEIFGKWQDDLTEP